MKDGVKRGERKSERRKVSVVPGQDGVDWGKNTKALSHSTSEASLGF